jgi:hypothetical protein
MLGGSVARRSGVVNIFIPFESGIIIIDQCVPKKLKTNRFLHFLHAVVDDEGGVNRQWFSFENVRL